MGLDNESNAGNEEEVQEQEQDQLESSDDIEAMKAALKKANEEAKKYRLQAKERQKLEKELDELRKANMTDTERKLEEVRAEERKNALSLVNDRIIKAEVRAVAGAKLADPMDAVRLLDLSKFEVDNDGNVDAGKIGKAVDELLKAKPYLGTAKSPGRLPGADGGSSPTGGNNMNDLIRSAIGRL
jgi:alanyl-tRNA synthetase